VSSCCSRCQQSAECTCRLVLSKDPVYSLSKHSPTEASQEKNAWGKMKQVGKRETEDTKSLVELTVPFADKMNKSGTTYLNLTYGSKPLAGIPMKIIGESLDSFLKRTAKEESSSSQSSADKFRGKVKKIDQEKWRKTWETGQEIAKAFNLLNSLATGITGDTQTF